MIKDDAKKLVFPDMGTMYRALSAEASTAFGLSPSLVVHDELGQTRGRGRHFTRRWRRRRRHRKTR